MPPVVAAVTAVAGFISTGVASVSGLVAGLGVVGKAAISIGLSLGSSLLQAALAKKNQGASGIQIELQAGGNIPRSVAFGRVVTEGHLIYHNLYGAKNNWLQMVFQLSDGGECDGLEKVWVDGVEATLGAEMPMGRPIDLFVDPKKGVNCGYLRFFSGAENQAADMQLVNNANPSGRWTTAARGAGCCYVSISLYYSERVFKGRPNFRFQLRGKKLYDLRKDSTAGGSGTHRFNDPSTYEWTDNNAVILYNYQRGIFVNGEMVIGQGVDVRDLNALHYRACANACDELVPLKGGGTEKRYRFGGMISDNASHGDNMKPIIQAMGGELIESVGEYSPFAGVAKIPVMQIHDGDIVTGESWTYSGSLTRTALINAVFGKFADLTQMGELVSFPPRTSLAAENEDGGQRYGTDIQLGGVQSGTQAQRISEILRRLGRLQRTEQIVAGAKFRPLDAGDWITRTSARFGNWIAIVTSRSIAPDGKINISLREVAGTAYAWNAAVDQLDGTTPADLPSTGGLIETVSGLKISTVDVVVAGAETKRPAVFVEWNPPEDATITNVVIECRLQGDPRFTTHVFTDAELGEGYIIDGIQSGAIYEARATIVTQPARSTDYTPWVTSLSETGVQTVPESIYSNTAGIAETVVNGSITMEKLSQQLQDTINGAVEDIEDFNEKIDDIEQQIEDILASIETDGVDLEIIRKALSPDPLIRASVAHLMYITAFDDLRLVAAQLGNLQAEMLNMNDGQKAIVARLTRSVSARFGDAFAAIAEESRVRAEDNLAIAQQLLTVNAELSNQSARIDAETQARTDDVSALTTTINQQQTQIDNKAESSAVNALTTRVSTAENNIVSQGSAITTLQSIVNDPVTGLNSKASADAVTALTTRVTNAEGNITAQANQLTTLTTTVGGHTSSITTLTSSVNGMSVQFGVTGTIDGVTGGFIFTGVRRLDGTVNYSVAINGDLIVTGSITADKMSVSVLSAISANVGLLRAGTITGLTSEKLSIELNLNRILGKD